MTKGGRASQDRPGRTPMKRAMLVGTALLVGGCYVESQPGYYSASGQYATGGYDAATYEVSVGPPAPVYYEAPPPPAPRYEVRPALPFYGAVWIDGYWDWRGRDWFWVGGRWAPPREG